MEKRLKYSRRGKFTMKLIIKLTMKLDSFNDWAFESVHIFFTRKEEISPFSELSNFNFTICRRDLKYTYFKL